MITGLLDSPRVFTEVMVRELERSGTIELDDQTLHRVDLTQVSDAQQRQTWLSARRGFPQHSVMRCFAYPGCEVAQRARAAATAVAYHLAVMNERDRAGANDDLLARPRLRVSRGLTLERFAALLTVTN